MSDTDVIVMAEAPLDKQSPGKRLRTESLVAHVATLGFQVHLSSMNGGYAKTIERLAHSTSIAPQIQEVRRLSPAAVLVAGLGAPHMLANACRLSQYARVIFDTCDSWNLQLEARRSEKGVSTVPSLAGRWLQRQATDVALFTYISARDITHDLPLLDSARARVIPQKMNDSLARLPQVRFPLTRLVIAADLTSFHNQAFFREHSQALSDAVASGALPSIEVYGRAEEPDLPPGFVHRGWADSLASIYGGNTGVIVTNMVGSGVPNKLLEAVSASRPVLAFEGVCYAPFTCRDRVYRWGSEVTIVDAAREMLVGAPLDDRQRSTKEVPWKTLSAEDISGAP